MSESKSGSFEEAVKSLAEAHMVKTRGTSATRFDSFIAGSKWALEYLAKGFDKNTVKISRTSDDNILGLSVLCDMIPRNTSVSLTETSSVGARNVILEQRVRVAEEEKQLWIDNNKNMLEVCDKKDELINELLRKNRETNEKHSSALEFYADSKNWQLDFGRFGSDEIYGVIVDEDKIDDEMVGGKLARATLEKIKKGTA